MNTSRIKAGKPWRGVALLALLLSLAGSILLAAAPPGPSPEAGGKLFQQKGCAACHTIGQGDRVGPDLKGVTAQRKRAWLIRWLLEPDKMLAEKDPIATKLLKKYNNVPMPNLGLSKAQAEELIAYLASVAQASKPRPPAGKKAPETTGNPIIGKDLFTGAIAFQNGGLSCMACHSIAGIGALGGGALGPDLTPVYGKLGAAMITWPQNVPPMKPIYASEPLTPQEQANLLAFFKGAVAQRPTQAIGQLALLSLAGLIVLLVLAQLTWRRRPSGVRRSLVKRGSK